jgi:uncharacterized protein YaeQ
VSTRFNVRLASEIANHPLPPKILLAQDPLEPLEHVLLKLLACVLFQRERLQIEPRLHDDNIPFIPDLIQLDYELHPALWIECGETPAAKLDKLAVKAPRAELWVVLRSAGEMEAQVKEMRRLGLRRNRYRLLGFEATIFDELLALLASRNELTLYRLDFGERLIQLDFNGVWFEGSLLLESF